MRYQLVEELAAGTVVVKSANGEEAILDRIELKANLKESLRLELHNELRQLAKNEAGVLAPGLLRYQGIEKFQEQYYIIRAGSDREMFQEFRPVSMEEKIQALQRVWQVMAVYHNQGLVMGGISLGLLKTGATGVVVQDPPLFNHLSKLLVGDYDYSLPPEVIKGSEWNRRADVFSWGELAYKICTGKDPFEAALPEDRVAKLLEGLVIDPRIWEPQLSESFSQLILRCLATDAKQRPKTADLGKQLVSLVEGKGYLASETEVKLFAGKSTAFQKQQQSREKWWVWWRKHKLVVLITAGMIAIGYSMTLNSRNPVITKQTTPLQVVAYYFKALKTVDVSLMDETVHGAKHSFSDVVANVHVINVSHKANEYELTRPDWIQVTVSDYHLKTLKQTKEQAVYQIHYQLKFAAPNENQYMVRQDRFTLTPVRKIWRITNIKVLKERRRVEKVTPPTPKPSATLRPVSTP